MNKESLDHFGWLIIVLIILLALLAYVPSFTTQYETKAKVPAEAAVEEGKRFAPENRTNKDVINLNEKGEDLKAESEITPGESGVVAVNNEKAAENNEADSEYSNFSGALNDETGKFTSEKKPGDTYNLSSYKYAELHLRTDIKEDVFIEDFNSTSFRAIKIYLNGHTIKGKIDVGKKNIVSIYGGSKAKPKEKTGTIDASDKEYAIKFHAGSMVGYIANVNFKAQKYGFYMDGASFMNDAVINSCILQSNATNAGGAGFFSRGGTVRGIENSVITGYYGIYSSSSFGPIRQSVVIGACDGIHQAGSTFNGPIEGSMIVGKSGNGIYSTGSFATETSRYISGSIINGKKYPCIIVGENYGIYTTGYTPRLGNTAHDDDMLYIKGSMASVKSTYRDNGVCRDIESGTFDGAFDCFKIYYIKGGTFLGGLKAKHFCDGISGGEFYYKDSEDPENPVGTIILRKYNGGLEQAKFYSDSKLLNINYFNYLKKESNNSYESIIPTKITKGENAKEDLEYTFYAVENAFKVDNSGYFVIKNITANLYRSKLLDTGKNIKTGRIEDKFVHRFGLPPLWSGN